MSAEQGYAPAQCRLGICYEFGIGVHYDYECATEMYKKAAEQGHGGALFRLGVYYETEVPDGYEHAVELYKKSAEQGYELAKKRLEEISQN